MITVVRVDNTELPYRIRHKGLYGSQLKKLEKNWDVSIGEDTIKQVETFARKHRLTFRGIPKSYFRIPTKRVHPPIAVASALWDKLYDYQKRGVSEIVCRLGSRALLGDEMGLGKSIQGVAFISHRINVLPKGRVLVVCPSYLQIHWQHEIKKFLNEDSTIWDTEKECPDGRIVILPYSKLCNRPVGDTNWNTVVADECHYIKTRTSKRTRAFIPLCVKTSKPAVLLMSGTPCVNRPNELYTQMYCVRPQHVLSYYKFAERYCDGKRTRFGYDDNGCSNADEMHWILKKEYMVRRLKRDVLTQLKPKMRYSVMLDVRQSMLTRLDEIRAEMRCLGSSAHDMLKRKALISEAYRETAKAKAREASKWVNDRLQTSEEPFLVFAHHQVMLNTIEENLEIDDYIRIDGNVNKEKRQAAVDKFQEGGVRVALLSILAAGTGLTLTKAHLVVFSELYWCPGTILQAEDRVHRVGQTSPVSIMFLLGNGTIDTRIYPQVVNKLKVLDKAVDGRSDRSMDTISII